MKTLGQFAGRLTENWEQTILRPFVVSLLTALVLFAASLISPRVRNFVFPREPMPAYPLICRAEPYVDKKENRVLVDFFIINKTGGDALLRMKLAEILDLYHKDGPPASPDIHLRYWRDLGRIEDVVPDDGFNKGKGNLRHKREKDGWWIVVESIEPRAIMKVTFRLAESHSDTTEVGRMAAESTVPFNFEDFQDACYTRPE